MTSSLPPAVSLDNTGPKVRALIAGGRWHTPQDCAKTCRPRRCISLRSSAACWADAGITASNNARTKALRVIGVLPALRFFASLCLRRSEGKRRAASGAMRLRDGYGGAASVRLPARARTLRHELRPNSIGVLAE